MTRTMRFLVTDVIALVAEWQRNGAGADQSEFALWANEKLLKIGGKDCCLSQATRWRNAQRFYPFEHCSAIWFSFFDMGKDFNTCVRSKARLYLYYIPRYTW